VGLRAHEAQEVLLVARWFRLNPSELERTVPVQALARVQGQGEGTATPG